MGAEKEGLPAPVICLGYFALHARIHFFSISFSFSFSFSHHHTALYRDVEAAEKQCNELEKVVALVENNRQRFRHIDNVSE